MRTYTVQVEQTAKKIREHLNSYMNNSPLDFHIKDVIQDLLDSEKGVSYLHTRVNTLEEALKELKQCGKRTTVVSGALICRITTNALNEKDAINQETIND